jgi:hypothetical protein
MKYAICLLLFYLFSHFYRHVSRLNALEASKFQAAPLHKYVKEANDCLERSKMERKHRKPSTLYHLTKYLVRNKNRRK